jgi:cell division septal protein FtsQ
MDTHRYNDRNPSRKYVSPQLQFRNPYFPRITPREKKSRLLKVYLFLAVLVIIGVLYLITFSGIFRITTISVNGATPDHERIIREITTSALRNKRLLVLPGDNGLWVNPQRLSQTLSDRLNGQVSFESLTVTKPNFKKIVINATERTAKILWQTDTKQFFLLDGRGVVFSPIMVSEEQPAPDLPLIKNVTKTETTIGAEIITAAQAETIIASVQQLHQRFPEVIINYATPIIRESVRTVCVDTNEETVNGNTNSKTNVNTNRNANTNTSSKNANIRPPNANLNTNATSDTNTNSNSNTEPSCETEEVATGRYAREILVNTAKDTDIYFSADESIEDQINAIGVLMNEKITDLNKISYIDVRYLPRAYYK